jgi:uncharacterized protein with HEPN domain
MRIIAAHAYDRIDYGQVWVTLRNDVPAIAEAVQRWSQSQPSPGLREPRSPQPES